MVAGSNPVAPVRTAERSEACPNAPQGIRSRERAGRDRRSRWQRGGARRRSERPRFESRRARTDRRAEPSRLVDLPQLPPTPRYAYPRPDIRRLRRARRHRPLRGVSDGLGPWRRLRRLPRDADRTGCRHRGEGPPSRPDGRPPPTGAAEAPELLVVPGGGWNDNDGVRREADAGDVPDAIRAHRDSGGEVASVCTGAMLLERAVVLGGRLAVTHRSAVEDLRAAGVEVLMMLVITT